MDVPDFDDLPPVEGMPAGCAWGVFDKNGTKDMVGTLNHLTPDVVRSAAAEVKEGVSISLNWPLTALNHIPIPGRRKLDHNVFALEYGGLGWDDELHFNTQSSSQWDSYVHWQHQASGMAYNGLKPTQETLSKESTAENAMPTIDHWHARGGMVARGVLVDFKAYADEEGIDFHAYGGHVITTEVLEAIAKRQGVEFRPGDVLILRTGATEVLEAPTPEDMAQMAKAHLTGVESSAESAKWIWNKRFAAVASDLHGFEHLNHSHGLNLTLHEHLLGLFGMPIGELWDLKKLAAYCKEKGRYSFMLTSMPLNVPCLVASPPNATAIF